MELQQGSGGLDLRGGCGAALLSFGVEQSLLRGTVPGKSGDSSCGEDPAAQPGAVEGVGEAAAFSPFPESSQHHQPMEL